LAAAARLAADLASAGVTVVSGLARGVDGEAHRAALKAGGRTVGILGSGWDRFYPREHKTLAEKMIRRGAVISEYPTDAGPAPENFPRRNRLIAALALGVVVVEAKERSGALITASLAAEYGREVFAVPGSIFSPLSRGPLALMQKGATPVGSAEDVLRDLPVTRETIRPGGAAAASLDVPDLPPGARRLWEALDHTPVGLDALAARAKLGPAEIGPACLALEMAGLARELPGKQFVRTEQVAR
jgi:DNA processing protein